MNKFKTLFIVPAALTLLLYCNALSAQSLIQVDWQKTIGSGITAEVVHDFAATPDGGYILAAHSNAGQSGDKTDTGRGSLDYWIVKLNAKGKVEWNKTYGGTGDDTPYSIAVTPDGGYIVAGTSLSDISGDKTGSRGSSDYWILKLDKNGNLEWQKTYGGNKIENCYKVITTSEGGYLVAGHSTSGINGDKTAPLKGLGIGGNIWILKLAGTGTIEWQKAYGGLANTKFPDIIQTKEGGYLVSCMTSGSGGDQTDTSRGKNDYWLIKLNSLGNFEWDKTLGAEDDEHYPKLVQTKDSGYVVCGVSSSGKFGDKTDTNRAETRAGNTIERRDIWIVKTNKNGSTIEWQHTYGGDGSDIFNSIQPTNDGGFIISAYSNSNQSSEKVHPGFGGFDSWIIKINDTGKLEWQKTYGGLEDERGSFGDAFCSKVIQNLDNSYMLMVSSVSGISGNKTDSLRGIWMVKLKEACPDTTFIDTVVCLNNGYELPWGQLVQTSGTYSYNYPPKIEGTFCDSVVHFTLSAMIDASVTRTGNTLTANDKKVSYQWIDCLTGAPIPGATQESYAPSEIGGSYALVVNGNGCRDTSACYDFKNTGIDDRALESKLSVYPNPAGEQVTIETKTDMRIQVIEIFNIIGAQVAILSGNNHQKLNWDIGCLPAGTYLLQIQTDKGTTVRKLTVRK